MAIIQKIISSVTPRIMKMWRDFKYMVMNYFAGIKNSPVRRVYICTVGKVASSSFLRSFKRTYSFSHGHSLFNSMLLLIKRVGVIHGHSLLKPKKMLNNSNVLIIAGVRNPISRNLSYFFQTYSDNYYNDTQMKSNEYRGENCFICTEAELCAKSPEEVIGLFKNSHWLYSQLSWYKEFIEITGIKSFDKEKGWDIYDLPNNNKLLVYKFEKLSETKAEICDYLKISPLEHTNNPKDKKHYNLYGKVKEKISYKPEYVEGLLETEFWSMFYSEEEIDSFKSID